MMFKKILVPLDGSSLAELALETAVPLAQQTHGKIILLQISTTHMPFYPSTTEAITYNLYTPEYSDEATRLSKKYLCGLRDGVGERYSDITWQVRVADGDPASIIVDVAQEEQIDLIIMSTHGRSGVERWVMGSVTERVLRYAPCPVLAVRSKRPLQKILITLDGSQRAEQSIPYAMELAEVFAANVTLLQARSTTSIFDLEAAALLNTHEHGLGERLFREAEDRADIYLESTWHDWRRDGVSLKTAVREGKPAQAILDYAQHNNIDLIAMSTHGLTGLRRWAYGSVTEKVLRHTDCAMLIVRSPEEE